MTRAAPLSPAVQACADRALARQVARGHVVEHEPPPPPAPKSNGNGRAAAPTLHARHEPSGEGAPIDDLLKIDKRGNGHGAKARIRPAELTKLRDLKMEKTDWIWKGWIARGEVCLIAGIPEAGKTTCALSIAAIFSSSGRWPDETLAKAGNIIIWTGEDTAKTVIGPRLVQMGADIS
jgi:AAA domain